MKYLIGVDQSTQGTKAVLFDEGGKLCWRVDKKHRQIINERGWVSHDLEEIYKNTLVAVKEVIELAGIDKSSIVGMGLSNQRETTAIWDNEGKPLSHAIVWQCKRAEAIAEEFKQEATMIYDKTGLPLSPYFPAAKMVWLLRETKPKKRPYLGTIDTWLVFKLTRGKIFATDVSNASRTQLFNIETLTWDDELCELFAIPRESLAKVLDSNACFGYTDFEGLLDTEIPIHSVMGDSHAALFGQMCHQPGMVKATYGTGSSIMMNTGDELVKSKAGLATSLAWSMDGKSNYVLEGNINYTGAVITWLEQDLKLIDSCQETEGYIKQANREDETVLVPAFSGLGAPYWNSEAKAMFYGMSRTTGRAELIKASIESIGFQVMDVLKAMQEDSKYRIEELRVDGGPTKNNYLMQFQSDMIQTKLSVSKREELSVIGVAYMAGITLGFYAYENVFKNNEYTCYEPKMEKDLREKLQERWLDAISMMK